MHSTRPFRARSRREYKRSVRRCVLDRPFRGSRGNVFSGNGSEEKRNGRGGFDPEHPGFHQTEGSRGSRPRRERSSPIRARDRIGDGDRDRCGGPELAELFRERR